jgi:phosphoribosylformylglycinamidine synthase
MDATRDGLATVAKLFGEAPSRVVVSVASGKASEVLAEAKKAGVPVMELGTTGGPRLSIRLGAPLIDVAVDDLFKAREACLVPIVGHANAP